MRITDTTTYAKDSSFMTPKISAKFQWAHPQWGRQLQVGRLHWSFSNNISLYLTNGEDMDIVTVEG